jgi:hypothetical protein
MAGLDPARRVEVRRGGTWQGDAHSDNARFFMTGEPIHPKEPIFVASSDVRRLCKRLAEAQVGDVLTYKELSALIARDIQTEARGALMSARRITQRERGIVFGTIMNEGLKRLSDIEIVQTGAQAVVRIRHASRRGAERIGVAAPEKLPIEARVQMNTYLTVLAAMHSLSQEKRLKKLEERVARAESRLPLDKTLEAFKD